MAEVQIAGALYEATRELLNLLGIHCAGCVDTIKAYPTHASDLSYMV